MDTFNRTLRLDGPLFAAMLCGGAAALAADKQAVNDLNVFPIPDGDTGDNMLLTARGGLVPSDAPALPLGETARRAAEGMLLGARGNSGVILSQFFDGLARGLDGTDTADAPVLCGALDAGVKQAYAAVMTPTEGTILTVMRESAAAAAASGADSITGCMEVLLTEAEQSLARTPDLLPVLREADVVDSGGAGFVDIIEGMLAVLHGEAVDVLTDGQDGEPTDGADDIDLESFGPDSVPEFGYCTELLLRLQTAKCDPNTFDVSVITDYLASVGGNSVVAFRTGSVVKLHVHIMHPQLVLAFCRRFGEFLTVKIENMSLQHSELAGKDSAAARTQAGLIPGQTAPSDTSKKPLSVVAVACGDGIKRLLREAGADIIVDGGQSMNPSAQDFLTAFAQAHADDIIVLPNNGNVILAARQAAALYTDGRVRVIETKTVGEGYAALCGVHRATPTQADAMETAMVAAAPCGLTACVSACVRDSDFGGVETHPGDFIGFVGKDILCVGKTEGEAACLLFDALCARGLTDGKTEFIIATGADAPAGLGEQVLTYVREHAHGMQIKLMDGGQAIYGVMFFGI